VLHRDLSSNNVLVADPQGRAQPKIIDFGIAKSLRDPLLQGGAMTFQGTLMGTPEFMSPEQALGRNSDIDTRADVYALGVQLYELLSDQLPIPGVVLRSQGLAGMAQVIQRHEPVLPSEACTPERTAALRGDLDSIVMKAIAKRRNERYASVGEFAADVRRHLADEPVQVASPSTWYRLRKFVRRHRAQIGGHRDRRGRLLAAVTVALDIATQDRDELQEQKERDEARSRGRQAARERGADARGDRRGQEPAPTMARACPAYAAWIAQHAEPLAKERPRVQLSLERLAARRAPLPALQHDDPADQHLEKALLGLQAALQTFLGDGGTVAEVLAETAVHGLPGTRGNRARSGVARRDRRDQDERWQDRECRLPRPADDTAVGPRAPRLQSGHDVVRVPRPRESCAWTPAAHARHDGQSAHGRGHRRRVRADSTRQRAHGSAPRRPRHAAERRRGQGTTSSKGGS
jgi:hypothetical protein